MPFWLDAGKDFLNFPICTDEERGTRDAHHFFPIHILLFEDIVSHRCFFLDVAQQRKRQMVLGFEPRLSGGSVGGDADDHGAFLVELLDGVTKLVRFGGSAGCVGAREKIQHQFLPFLFGELKGFARVGLELDIRCLIAFFEHGVKFYRRDAEAAEELGQFLFQ